MEPMQFPASPAPQKTGGGRRALGFGLGLGGALLCLLGVGLLIPGGGLYAFDANQRANWVLTTGTVTGLFTKVSVDTDTGSRTTIYCPTVEFETAEGQSVTVDINDCSFPAAFQVGDPAELYYDPQNPERVSLKNSTARVVGTVFSALLGGLGLICIVPGVLLMIAGLVLAVTRRRAAR